MKDEMNSTSGTEGLTLVLGGTGKTGRRVVERLARRGVRTYARRIAATGVWDVPSSHQTAVA